MNKLVHNIGRFWFLILIGIFVIWAIVDDGDSSSSSLPPPATTTNSQSTALPPPAVPISLPNGTVIKRVSTYLQGDGTLEIDNGTSQDAEAKLIRNGTSVFTVYIRAGSDYTIENISDGTYWLAFASGSNWNNSTETFTEDVSDSSFQDTFDFETTDTQYTTYSITLNPVTGGTAATDDVSQSQFDAY